MPLLLILYRAITMFYGESILNGWGLTPSKERWRVAT